MSQIAILGGGGAGATPGGANTDVQFNNAGSFGGDSGFTYAGSGGALAYTGVSATFDVGANSDVVISQWSSITAYNGLSFNGLSGSSILGLYGGATGDNTLYFNSPTGGGFFFTLNGTTAVASFFNDAIVFGDASGTILKLTSTTLEYDLPGVAKLLDYSVTTADTWTFSSSKNVAITGSLLIQNVMPRGASGSLPGIYTQLTTDTPGDNRIALALDGANNPYLGLGPGGSAAQDIFLNRQGIGLFGIGSTTTNTGGSLVLTDLTTNDAAALIKTGTALNNGAGSSTGTLLTAPSAGNPTKWIPINDNGTTRYVPAW